MTVLAIRNGRIRKYFWRENFELQPEIRSIDDSHCSRLPGRMDPINRVTNWGIVVVEDKYLNAGLVSPPCTAASRIVWYPNHDVAANNILFKVFASAVIKQKWKLNWGETEGGTQDCSCSKI